MTMAKDTRNDDLPRPAEELEELANYYATHVTPPNEDGEWVEPQPMVTTSLRLPKAVIDAIKAEARQRGVRHTMLLRSIVEQHVRSPEDRRWAQLEQRVDRIEAQLAEKEAS